MNEVLAKPFEARQLVELINKLLLIKQNPISENVSKPKKVKNKIKSYDYSGALQLANDNKELFNRWLVHFCTVVKETSDEVKTIISKGDYPKKSRLFHGILNYSLFFGIDELKSCIDKLVKVQDNPNDPKEVAALYKQISHELKNIDLFFSRLINHN
jgi:HPt (histidine-containing phosphotransfer) domain-containing protein